MPRIVKNNAVLEAYRVEEPIMGPGRNRDFVPIATVGDWATYQETEEGELVFRGFLTEKEFREKHRQV